MSWVPWTILVFLLIQPASAATDSQPLDKSLQESMLKLRDPFRRPPGLLATKVRSELETVRLDKVTLTGVLTGAQHLKAMVRANDKTYFISENSPIGTRNGFVKKISSKSVTVRERVSNVLGREEVVETELKLQESKKE